MGAAGSPARAPVPDRHRGLVQLDIRVAGSLSGPQAPVAQLDRASDFESEGREFESLRARHSDPAHSGHMGAVITGHPRDPSTTTFALIGARWYRSITSWLIMRMQPDDTLLPMVHGSTVPWMR